MTVKDLVEQLKKFPQDALIIAPLRQHYSRQGDVVDELKLARLRPIDFGVTGRRDFMPFDEWQAIVNRAPALITWTEVGVVLR